MGARSWAAGSSGRLSKAWLWLFSFGVPSWCGKSLASLSATSPQHPPTTAQTAVDRNFPKTTAVEKNYCQLFYLRDAHSLTTASYCLQRGDAIAGVVAIKGWQRVTPCHPVSPACHLRVTPCRPVSPPCRPRVTPCSPPPRTTVDRCELLSFESVTPCRPRVAPVSPRVAPVSPPVSPRVAPVSPRVTLCRLRVTPCRLRVTPCHRVTPWSCFSLFGAT